MDKDRQELEVLKVLGIEAWQAVVTDVDGKASAIADGVREIGAPIWSDPQRADALSQMDQQILLINLALALDSRSGPTSGLVCALRSCVYGFVHEYWRVVDVCIEQ